MKRILTFFQLLLFFLVLFSCKQEQLQVKPSKNDLVFSDLAKTWDEGMPLGNSIIGSLIWQKDSVLRMSLDRVDLWDQRPTENIWGENFSFDWVYQQVERKTMCLFSKCSIIPTTGTRHHQKFRELDWNSVWRKWAS